MDSRTSVTDVKFAPKTLGLLLATCNADGFIRIYEAPDIMNLSQWTLQHDINCRLSLSCLTWNPSLSRYQSAKDNIKLNILDAMRKFDRNIELKIFDTFDAMNTLNGNIKRDNIELNIFDAMEIRQRHVSGYTHP